MTDNYKLKMKYLKEKISSLFLWITPWIIIFYTIIFYHIEMPNIIDLGINKPFLLGCYTFYFVVYIITSYWTFKGIVLPAFKNMKEKEEEKIIECPSTIYSLSTSGIDLRNSLNKIQSSKEAKVLKTTTLIVIRDYLDSIYTESYSTMLKQFIPSIKQIRKYPNESLNMMLSSHKLMPNIGENKYYNFELILNSCIKGIKDSYGKSK